jgi:hypothetical protein
MLPAEEYDLNPPHEAQQDVTAPDVTYIWLAGFGQQAPQELFTRSHDPSGDGQGLADVMHL